jgi:hypothetical protein
MSALRQFVKNVVAPRQETVIADSNGKQVTVTSTQGGGTSLNSAELYRTKPVQEFIKAVTAKPATGSGE